MKKVKAKTKVDWLGLPKQSQGTGYGNPNRNQRSGGSGTQDVADDYKPEASGYIYSGDLMSDMGGSEIMIGEVQKKHNPAQTVAAVRNAAKENRRHN